MAAVPVGPGADGVHHTPVLGDLALLVDLHDVHGVHLEGLAGGRPAGDEPALVGAPVGSSYSDPVGSRARSACSALAWACTRSHRFGAGTQRGWRTYSGGQGRVQGRAATLGHHREAPGARRDDHWSRFALACPRRSARIGCWSGGNRRRGWAEFGGDVGGKGGGDRGGTLVGLAHGLGRSVGVGVRQLGAPLCKERHSFVE
jgi:hypothetical protein